MNKCLKRSLGAGAFLLLAMVVAAGCYVFWPKQSIALPNGDRVKVEAVTWRPDNRFPTTSAAPLIGLLIKLFDRLKMPGVLNDPYRDIGVYYPGVIWMSDEGGTNLARLEIRLRQGLVESSPLRSVASIPSVRAGRTVSAFAMETVPQDGNPLIAEVYWRESKGAAAQRVGVISLAPIVGSRYGTNVLLVAAVPATNEPRMVVKVMDFLIPETVPPTNVLDRSILRIQIHENSAVSDLSTNWEVASIEMENKFGDVVVQNLDNRGFKDGTLRVGMRPVWLDGQPWKLRIGLVRDRGFPKTNEIRLGPLFPSGPSLQRSRIVTNVFGRIVTARLETGAQEDPIPMVTNWQASVSVRMSGSFRDTPHHLRWVGLTDQRGTNYGFSTSAWGGELFRWRLNRESDFTDGTVTSAEAVLSWEPVEFVEVVTVPKGTTNFTDWPQSPKETNRVADAASP